MAPPRPAVIGDVELEAGCGVVAITDKNRSHVHTTQWAIGLECALLMRDPWRLALSTDPPNGGPFVSYPRGIRLLTDREYVVLGYLPHPVPVR